MLTLIRLDYFMGFLELCLSYDERVIVIMLMLCFSTVRFFMIVFLEYYFVPYVFEKVFLKLLLDNHIVILFLRCGFLIIGL